MTAEINKQRKLSMTQKNYKLVSFLLYVISDYIALLCANFISLHIRNFIMQPSVFTLHAVYIYFWTPLIYFLFLFYEGLYTKRMVSYRKIRNIFYACIGSLVVSVLLMFMAHVAGNISRLYILLFALFSFVLLCLGRLFINHIIRSHYFFKTPTLIVGAGKTADAVVRQIEKEPSLGYAVIGFLEDFEPHTDFVNKYPILGGFNDLPEVVRKTNIQSILIAAPGLSQKRLSELIDKAQSLVKEIGVVPNLINVPMSNISVQSFFDERFMVLHIENNLKKTSNKILKRVFDIVFTVGAGLCLLPVLLGIALWVHFDSPGPVFFKHKRIGKDGKPFYCYKFRSMCMNSQEVLENLLKTDPKAREEWERDFKLKNDPRITKSGAFLRKTSLDELPQLLNVLKGEMSLVGPRPIVAKEIPKYGNYFSEYKSVYPGITGIWQTSGRSDVDYPERVRMDSWYVHNWSVWLDLLLLWRTIGVVFKEEGAY